jgi:hypothetical protein
MKASNFRVFVALCLGVAAAASAQADQIGFGVQINADGQIWDIPLTNVEGTDLQAFDYVLEDDVEGDGYRVVISGLMDPDPYISWGVAITDFGTPSTFSYVFVNSIVPTGSPNVVTGSISGGLTDSTGDGVWITPAAVLGDPDGDAIAELAVNEVGFGGPPVYTNMGVDVGSAVSFGPGVPGANYTYGPFNTGPFAGPVGVWTSLQSRVSFTMSGGGDVVSLTGYASIVPEPSTIALVTIGAMSVLGRLALRRRKA